MKKIIATVLAMVMALALCTTAFAAGTTTTDVESKGYTLLDAETNDVVTIKGEKFTKTVATENKVSGVTYYFADVYAITTTDSNLTLYACDSSIADYKLVKGNAVVYLTTDKVNGPNGTEGISKVVDKKIDAVAEPTCGEFQKNADHGMTTVFVIDNETYWAGGEEYAMLNGKAVSYGGKATSEPHDFTKQNVTTDNKGNVVSVTCDTCKKSFKVVDSIPASYLGTVATDDGAKLEGLFILTGEAYAAGSTTDTTTSPKTFDAGIAMYVGMALTSVAGSAVVIGKKKEF